MSVTYQSVGAVGQGSASCAPACPVVVNADDLLVLPVAWGNSTDDPPATPSGWTAPANNVYIGGAGSWGLDTGHRNVSVFYKIADGTEDLASVTVNNGGSGTDRCISGQIARLTKTLTFWYVTVVGGSDSSLDTSFAIVAASDPGAVNGDVALFAGGWAPDTAGASSAAIVWAGTGTGATQIQSIANSNGNDQRFLLFRRALTGTSTDVPSFTATGGANVSGSGAIILIHDGPITGTGSAALPSATASGEGTVDSGSVSGSGAATLPTLTASSAGTLLTDGSSAATMPAASADGSGTVTTTGAGDATLPSTTSSGSGTLLTDGSATIILPAASAAGAGDVTTDGSSAAALPAAAASGSGDVTTTGAAAATLPALTASSEGAVGDIVTGTGAATLPSLTTDGAGTVTSSGAGTATLPTLVGAAAGTVTVTSSGAATLPGLSAQAAGFITISGDGVAVLPALVATGTDVVPRDITVTAELAPARYAGAIASPLRDAVLVGATRTAELAEPDVAADLVPARHRALIEVP